LPNSPPATELTISPILPNPDLRDSTTPLKIPLMPPSLSEKSFRGLIE